MCACNVSDSCLVWSVVLIKKYFLYTWMLVSAKKAKVNWLDGNCGSFKCWENNWVLTSLHPIKLFSRSLKYLYKTVCRCIVELDFLKREGILKGMQLFAQYSFTVYQACLHLGRTVCWPDFAHFVGFSHFKLSAMCLSKSCIIFFSCFTRFSFYRVENFSRGWSF